VEETGATTRRVVPDARSTEDIDLFLLAEVISDEGRLGALRDALLAQGYAPIEKAHFFQFGKEATHYGQKRTIKIDLLAPIPADEDAKARTRRDTIRIRNRKIKDINAHVALEALTLDENLLTLEISDGQYTATVYSPHPYTFLVLKLHAYRDLREKEAKDFGRHHAFDLYRILAMITKREWEEAEALRDRYQEHDPIREAGQIVKEFFGDEIARGTIALREDARRGSVDLHRKDILEFMRDLRDLFPSP
jgi:hypothetical protein